jgi:RNA polymerase sigma-70 factor (ECF subfamily)
MHAAGAHRDILLACIFFGSLSMDSTPISLLERLKRPGDAAAWERFVALYAPLLYHWVRRAGLQEADAADLVQEVFAVLVAKLPEFVYDRDKSFHGWLRTVVMNRWRDRRKKKTVPPAGAEESEPFTPDPLETFIEREFRGRLALRALQIMRADFQPATYQAVWELVVDARPAADVSREHGFTLGALYAAKCRVLARLRQELQGLWV